MVRKLSPVSAGILAFERSRNIKSQLYYLQRLALYLILAGGVGVTEQYYPMGAIWAGIKGLLFGVSFGSAGVGLLLGCANAGASVVSQEVLSDFI